MKKITLAKVIDGSRVRATMEITVKVENRKRQTTDHQTVGQYKAVSISGSITGGSFGSHGQCIDEINQAFGENEHVKVIHGIWKRYHLNDMKPGCIHQAPGVASDATVVGQTCKESGYRYGSQWLVEIVPDEVIVKLQAAVDGLTSLGYQPTHVEAFCSKHGVKLDKVTLVDETKNAIEYHIKLAKAKDPYDPKAKSFVIPSFKMGVGLKNKNGQPKRPDLNDIITCLVSDSRFPEDFEEFCSDLGYDEDSRDAMKTFKTVSTQTKKLREFLGDSFEEFTQIEES